MQVYKRQKAAINRVSFIFKSLIAAFDDEIADHTTPGAPSEANGQREQIAVIKHVQSFVERAIADPKKSILAIVGGRRGRLTCARCCTN